MFSHTFSKKQNRLLQFLGSLHDLPQSTDKLHPQSLDSGWRSWRTPLYICTHRFTCTEMLWTSSFCSIPQFVTFCLVKPPPLTLFSIMSHSSILMDLDLFHLLLQLCLIVRSDQYFLSMVPTFPR